MKKPMLQLLMVIRGVGLAAVFYFFAAVVAFADPGKFVHPGLWHTESELECVRNNVAARKQPWLDAWNALKNSDINTNYQPRVATNVTDP